MSKPDLINKKNSPEDSGMTRRDFLKFAATSVTGMAAVTLLNKFYYPVSAALSTTQTDTSTPAIIRQTDKCIGCGSCVEVCENTQKIGIYQLYKEDGKAYSDTKGHVSLLETSCINCGQCVKVCPVGALTEKDSLKEALAALSDTSKHIVWQIAPSVQNMLGEEFGLSSGADVTKKIASAMKLLGGDAFNTDFGADVTIVEESYEFINRLQNGGPFPMITSCCPGWIKYAEFHYPDLFDYISSCKSPQQMFGALVKSYYAEKNNLSPEQIFHISVMPCTAKKFECSRGEMENSSGIRDVDLVLTSREFAQILRSKGIALSDLEDTNFDHLMGESSGAARIFGTSGGVMESALRTVVSLQTNKTLSSISFDSLRTQNGIKTATLDIGGSEVRAAVVNGIGNISSMMNDVLNGTSPYHFIEVMACPGGCIGGGGAPLHTGNMTMRQDGIYRSDKSNSSATALENNAIKRLYGDYLGKPCGKLSEQLLHTSYIDRSNDYVT